MQTVAVLCVARNSIYKELPSVEAYDCDRDARTFAGGMPIVAHPPCRAWSAFCSHQAKPLEGEKDLAPMCADWLKQCGGVLEHPANSRLWDYCNLPKPGEPERDGYWSISVKQCWWGDTRSKNTWLLFYGVEPCQVELPFALHSEHGDRRRWQVMSKHQRAATPRAFAEWLVGVARCVKAEVTK